MKDWEKPTVEEVDILEHSMYRAVMNFRKAVDNLMSAVMKQFV